MAATSIKDIKGNATNVTDVVDAEKSDPHRETVVIVDDLESRIEKPDDRKATSFCDAPPDTDDGVISNKNVDNSNILNDEGLEPPRLIERFDVFGNSSPGSGFVTGLLGTRGTEDDVKITNKINITTNNTCSGITSINCYIDSLHPSPSIDVSSTISPLDSAKENIRLDSLTTHDLFIAGKMADNCEKQYVQLYTGAESKSNMSKDNIKDTEFSQNLNEKPVKVRPKQKKTKMKDKKRSIEGNLMKFLIA